MPAPNYLKSFADLWQTHPKQANQAWFEQAKWGLFIHYGLYSQLGRGEWALFHEQIPLTEYEKLYDTFDPSGFDAEAITDLAIAAGMSYVNLVSCHHEGFPLWASTAEPWNSANACGRDLVRELGEACDRKGLGFFLYFTHIINWRHPAALPLDITRPAYDPPESRYLDDPKACYEQFWAWSHALTKELCSFDFPVAGIWLDIIACYYKYPQFIPIDDTYALIRQALPHGLLAFKQGANGTEDYASPEFAFHSMGERMRASGLEDAAKLADAAWAINQHKHNEICMTLQKQAWGYKEDTSHYTAQEVRQRLAYAHQHNCNMLCNVGPLADGSIHPADIATLQAVGQGIREQGWPTPAEAITPESWLTAKKDAAAE